MAQRQFRQDDTSNWTDKFGNGSDGAYAPSTGTDAPIDSACTGTSATTSLTATNVSFASGQLILIHQTQGTGAGNYELNRIASYTAGTITTTLALTNTYGTGAQVVVLKQYSSALIDTGVTLTTKAWTGTVGGIVGWFCNGITTVTGNITGKGRGYQIPGTAAYCGEGTAGPAIINHPTKNGNGGGSATFGNGGGGGGNAVAGTSGSMGEGGDAAGNAALTLMVFGGGGGGDTDNGGNTTSGGIVILISKTITVTGTITVDGNSSSYGGASAGGSILLKGKTITLGSTLVTSAGASSSNGGGASSVGRIHADYSGSISGTTSPTIDSTQDATIIEAAVAAGGVFTSSPTGFIEF